MQRWLDRQFLLGWHPSERMPSPIAHLSASYLVYCGFRAHCSNSVPGGSRRALLAATAALSLLPDADVVVGVAARDMGRYHASITHSLLAGIGCAVVAGGLKHLVFGGDGRSWFALSLASYVLHLVLDAFGSGRGLMFFWPFSQRRFRAPVRLFHGLRWSQGWWTRHHLCTLATELPLVGLSVVAMRTRWGRWDAD